MPQVGERIFNMGENLPKVGERIFDMGKGLSQVVKRLSLNVCPFPMAEAMGFRNGHSTVTHEFIYGLVRK